MPTLGIYKPFRPKPRCTAALEIAGIAHRCDLAQHKGKHYWRRKPTKKGR